LGKIDHRWFSSWTRSIVANITVVIITRHHISAILSHHYVQNFLPLFKITLTAISKDHVWTFKPRNERVAQEFLTVELPCFYFVPFIFLYDLVSICFYTFRMGNCLKNKNINKHNIFTFFVVIFKFKAFYFSCLLKTSLLSVSLNW
jgi:hypothetical protein